MRAKLGIAPIARSDDDLPEFSGVVTGGKFPKRAAELRPKLEALTAALAGAGYRIEG